ncbi:hypothetical protein [Methylobacterium sp. 17Sr1-1]|nr:hypothetical protein [Methylobacterium sp. 17Sr1-1]
MQHGTQGCRRTAGTEPAIVVWTEADAFDESGEDYQPLGGVTTTWVA